MPELVFEAVERGREAAGVAREGDPVGEKEVNKRYRAVEPATFFSKGCILFI